MISRPVVIGFHGCDRSLAEDVVMRRTELLPSREKWDWLGHGIYFWEDSPSRAMLWAQQQAMNPKSKVKNPAVLGAVIDLGNCLNLTDAADLALVRDTYHIYISLCEAKGEEVALNSAKARNLDCAVIQSLHELREASNEPPFDSVRGFFIEGSELYEASGFRDLDHVQICVRSRSSIIGYFLPDDFAARQCPELD